MAPKGPTFVFGDRDVRPMKGPVSRFTYLRDLLTFREIVSLGIVAQLIASLTLPTLYSVAFGFFIVIYSYGSNILIALKIKKNPHIEGVVHGKTAAVLDFANPIHLGKPPGAAADDLPEVSEWDPDLLTKQAAIPPKPKLAVLLVGSRCDGQLGPFDPDYIFIRNMFAKMVKELQTATQEEDMGYLNSELFLQSERSQNNVSMAVIYWKSYEHIRRFAHRDDITHWKAWTRFRKMQRNDFPTSKKIGLWHEAYEVSNAEAIYHNMRPFGLGNLWDFVPTPQSSLDTEKGDANTQANAPKGKWRSSLVTATGSFFTSNGRMRVSDGKDWSNELYYEQYDKKEGA
ncbi:hypothetical protein SISNIDRAFT_493634 [Sistotremastrum niveocremeum HHB9708]|uniref:Uncharacterized protein n=1 Tax=Sistotremastrum niveocremeum HHB9708 TaxID=1314777 RepID=A0A164YA64_9AGAM|nr:hypothetical protein SISNIDRAFT_493634 [Sistotremastrum niveocremeum HHB9708]